MGGYAWVTLATNDSYSLGALVLAHSLKQVKTSHPLAILITPGVTGAMRNKLAAIFDVVQEVNILDSKDETNLKLLKRPELGVTFTKLHCWRLTQFDKCVFLDADTLVLQNCDELFEREELSAAPDVGWPDCFNSGVFVYRPSNETFDKLIQFALEKGSFDGGDQGLLNLYFSDWATKDISKHLPFIYNLCSTACYSYLPAFKQFGADTKIIHFIGSAKPWLQYFNSETRKVQPSSDLKHLEGILQYWWNIFCASIHADLSSEMSGLAGALAQLTLGAPRTAEQSALDDHLRRQGWEVGNIDYMGRDSFDNIWSKICQTISSEPPAPVKTPEATPSSTSVQPVEKTVTPETQPSAPAPEEAKPASETQSIPTEEAKVVVCPIVPDSTCAKPPSASEESACSTCPRPVVCPLQPKPQPKPVEAQEAPAEAAPATDSSSAPPAPVGPLPSAVTEPAAPASQEAQTPSESQPIACTKAPPIVAQAPAPVTLIPSAPSTEPPTPPVPSTEASPQPAPTTEASQPAECTRAAPIVVSAPVAPTPSVPSTEAPPQPAPTAEAPPPPAPTTAAPPPPAPTTEAPAPPATTAEVPASPAPTTEAPAPPAPTTEVPASPAPTTTAPPPPAPTTEVPASPAPTTAAPPPPAPTTETPASPVPTTEAPAPPAPSTEAETPPAPSTEAALAPKAESVKPEAAKPPEAAAAEPAPSKAEPVPAPAAKEEEAAAAAPSKDDKVKAEAVVPETSKQSKSEKVKAEAAGGAAASPTPPPRKTGGGGGKKSKSKK